MTDKRRSKALKRLNRKRKKKERELNQVKIATDILEDISNLSKYAISRILLDCDQCDLVEDKKLEGPVITRFRLSKGGYGDPTDMLFKEINKDEFECPNCKNIIKAKSLDDDEIDDQ